MKKIIFLAFASVFLVACGGGGGDSGSGSSNANRLISVDTTNKLTGTVISRYEYTYDQNGKVSEYNETGIDPTSEELQYDSNGRVIRIIRQNPSSGNNVSTNLSSSFEYDNQGRIATETLTNPDSNTVDQYIYQYDINDNVIMRNNTVVSNKNDTYSYSLTNKLTKIVTSLETYTYTYDVGDNLVLDRFVNNATNTIIENIYRYDGGRLVGVYEYTNSVITDTTTLTYSSNRLASTERGNNISTFNYDGGTCITSFSSFPFVIREIVGYNDGCNITNEDIAYHQLSF